MRELRDRIALVTGGSRGIGPRIARALARQGVHVGVAARDAAGLGRTVDEVRGLGVRAEALQADLSSAEAREALVARATEVLGAIDILVNNAGLEPEGPFAEIEPAAIEVTVEVNLIAPMHLTRQVLPEMIERDVGHVVNIASLGGKKGAPYDAVYCGTKAALVEWTAGVRAELEGTGVSLSAICPGYVREIGMFARHGMRAPALLGSCSPDDVANAVVDAIRRDRPEVIVNDRPVRLLLALNALFPRLGARMLTTLGITEFQRRKASGDRRAP